jgi:long-chain fatty acid transport protein
MKMKKTIKLAVVAALALGTTSAFATNGSALIGTGAKARAMGGVGIGMGHGAESALTNPALITSIKKDHEISFGGTIFMPDVENTNNIGGGDSSTSSAADMNVIPEVSLATKINDNLYIGVGMWGTAGMGVDYRDANTAATGGTQMQMVTNLQLMQFGVPVAYTIDGLSIGITPVLQYGALDINYEYPGNPNPGTPAQGTNFGSGIAQDLSFGFNLGLSYETNGLTVGAMYKSQIDMEYKGVMSKTVNAFSTTGSYANDKLSTPAEMGIGASYTMDEHTLAIDYKRIMWSDAKGYEDFEWDDQDVIALGYQFETKDWAARVGYNYAKSPISEKTVLNPNTDIPNSAGLQPGTVNTFNLLGFPAFVESHVTLGGTYNLSETTSVDLTYVYALEAEETFKNFAAQNITTKHSQTSVSAQLNFAF